MKKRRAPKEIPVTQRDLAAYLGISASMFHMAESGRYTSHNLSSASSLKMAELILAHQQAQKSGSPGASLRKRQEAFNRDAGKVIKTLELVADHSFSRAKVLTRSLAEMTEREQADSQWLNTVDRLLATLAGNKETKGDRAWLELQQLLVIKRLQKNGRLEQAKLQMQIQLEKAKAAINRAMIKKLKKEMK
ncbi:MAG TPA: hypothetical protein PKC54_03925 [Ferruginibacter sp.]|nr:hypothetical protein [Ferruginibacter sp.]